MFKYKAYSLAEVLLLVFIFDEGSSVFVVVTGYIDRRKLQGVYRYYLEVEAALIALYRLAFFYFIGIDDNRVIAFGTYNSHDRASSGFGSRPAYRMIGTAFADSSILSI
jgi:hypothetical protein